MITKNQTIYTCDGCGKTATGSKPPEDWIVPGYSEHLTGFYYKERAIYIEWHDRCFCCCACLGEYTAKTALAEIHKPEETEEAAA